MAKKIVSRKKTSVKSVRLSRAPKAPAARPSFQLGFWAVFFGIAFGFFLSKSRATDFDTIINMFLFTDFQLYGVIAVAIAVTALGLFLLHRYHPPTAREIDQWDNPVIDRKKLIGALVFGAGWALAGICPGTALTQLGEGKCSAVFPILGLIAGFFIYFKFMPESKTKK
jgi:uncharacterized membrane protein YedE/YeeE